MQIPDPSRRTLLALVSVVAGIVAITLALLSGSDPDSGGQGPDRAASIDPVEPLDPDDAGATGGDEDEDVDPLDSLKNPFSASFGGKVKHKVTVRATANGPAGVGVRFRGEDQNKQTFNGSFSTSRTIKSRFPMVQVAVQIYPPSTTGSCTVIIDGQEVSSYTTKKRFGVVVCGG